MGVRMKALTAFRGKKGEGSGVETDWVARGTEFETTDERAKELQRLNLAVPTIVQKAERAAPKNKAETPPANKDDKDVKMIRRGFETGAAQPSSASAPAQAPRSSTSRSRGRTRG